MGQAVNKITSNDFLKVFTKRFDNLDSDNDGLKDWEEVLWQTDINNSDSDKDGYSDKEEVDNGYDPLDFASSPKTGKKKVKSAQFNEVKIPESLNLTQQLAKNISAQIINKKDVDFLADSDPMSVMDENISQAMTVFIASLKVQLPDSYFNATNDNGADSFKNYSKELQVIIFNNDRLFGPKSELDFVEAIQKGDFSAIDNFINVYDMVLGQLRNVVVPSSFLPTHKRAAELMMMIRKSLEGIKRVDADPWMAIISINQAQENLSEMQKLMPIFFDLFQKYK